jgi:hypothetical protein
MCSVGLSWWPNHCLGGGRECLGQVEEIRQNAELCSRPCHKANTKSKWVYNIGIKAGVTEVANVVSIKPNQIMGTVPLLYG